MNQKSTDENHDGSEREMHAENAPQDENAAADPAQDPDGGGTRSAGTPYDIAFRTLVQETPRLLIWLINEMFGKSYPDDAVVEHAPTEFVLAKADGTKARRTMDSHFGIRLTDEAGHSEQYHLEEESRYNAVMPRRMWEYAAGAADVEIALGTEAATDIYFPASGLLYLRPPAGQPGTMPLALHLRDENGQEYVAQHVAQVITPHDYTLDQLFEKRLYLLLPFYIFQYEKKLAQIEEDVQLRARLAAEFEDIRKRLEDDESEGKLDPYESWTVRETIRSVADALAANAPKTRKEVTEMMYGPVLDYEAKRIRDAAMTEGWNAGRAEGWNAGRAEGWDAGRAEGWAEGEIFGLIRAVRALGFSCAQQAEFLQAQLNISLSQAHEEIAAFDKQSGGPES